MAGTTGVAIRSAAARGSPRIDILVNDAGIDPIIATNPAAGKTRSLASRPSSPAP
jgi:hypothetical protein